MNLKTIINVLKSRFIYGLRRTYWKPRLKHLGKNVRIEKGVIISNPKVVSIGDHSWIDKYTIIEGGKGIEIGRYVHIVTLCHIQGGGTVKIGDYVAIASGTKIYSDTNYYTKRMSGALPLDQQDIKAGQVTIGKDAFVGLNSVVLPGVTIGEGAVIGAGSVVNRDIPSWSIAIGLPARVVDKRPKHNLPDI